MPELSLSYWTCVDCVKILITVLILSFIADKLHLHNGNSVKEHMIIASDIIPCHITGYLCVISQVYNWNFGRYDKTSGFMVCISSCTILLMECNYSSITWLKWQSSYTVTNNYIPQKTVDFITYPCSNINWLLLVKGALKFNMAGAKHIHKIILNFFMCVLLLMS